MVRVIRYLWVAPVSLPAAALALLAAGTGSSLSRRDGVLEASGGMLRGVLRWVYPPMPIAAITLGHVILAQTASDLESSREHERVHVRQYEVWGPLFPLVYLAASLTALLRGAHPYFDNRYEIEARRLAPFSR
jgi:hypothetical protein